MRFASFCWPIIRIIWQSSQQSKSNCILWHLASITFPLFKNGRFTRRFVFRGYICLKRIAYPPRAFWGDLQALQPQNYRKKRSVGADFCRDNMPSLGNYTLYLENKFGDEKKGGPLGEQIWRRKGGGSRSSRPSSICVIYIVGSVSQECWFPYCQCLADRMCCGEATSLNSAYYLLLIFNL